MKKLLDKHEEKFQRFLEIIPGFLAWNFILFPFWGSFFMPKAVAYITIGFLVFWFYRSFQAAILGISGYFKIKHHKTINWRKKYEEDKNKDSLDWESIRHLIVIPNYMESVKKIASNLNSIAKQKDIDPSQIIVVLAMEGRAEGHQKRAKALVKKFDGKFGKLLVAIHPDNIKGEIKGKASNEAWAAKMAKKILVDEEGVDINNITITSCDADAIFDEGYFSCLAYNFCTNNQRYTRFWQSPIFWYNNLDRVPVFIRITGIMGNIIHISSLQEPDNLIFNYSCYSSSLKMIDGVGYWHTNIIPEDWHIFLQTFFENMGKVEVNPIFLPTSIDAPEGANYLGSLKARYEQCKRHAWGATDIPFAIKEAIKHSEIPLFTRAARVYKIIESHFIWSTNWFILTFGALIPTVVNPVFKQTALGYNLPKISQIILTTCLLSLVSIIILDIALRPPKPKNYPLWKNVFDYLQWIMMPVATLLMSVLPGLDSQTRLMFGKRLEYWVTEKFD
ncbi:MAG: hypothetical protein ABIH88_00510 [Patescibacteria group bacterium]